MAFRRTTTSLPVASVDESSDYGSDIDHDLLVPDAHTADNLTDYGSELDTEGEEILAQLVSGFEANSGEGLVLESIVEDDNQRCVVHLPKYSSQDATHNHTTDEDPVVEIEIDIDIDAQNAPSDGKIAFPLYRQNWLTC
jgi:hypothetical protein